MRFLRVNALKRTALLHAFAFDLLGLEERLMEDNQVILELDAVDVL